MCSFDVGGGQKKNVVSPQSAPVTSTKIRLPVSAANHGSSSDLSGVVINDRRSTAAGGGGGGGGGVALKRSAAVPGNGKDAEDDDDSSSRPKKAKKNDASAEVTCFFSHPKGNFCVLLSRYREIEFDGCEE